MSGNYSLDNLDERVAEAKKAHADRLETLLAAYKDRCIWRLKNNVTPLAICGMGRAGKDTAGEYICAHTSMVYPRSASWMVLPFIAHMIGIPEEQAYAERHQNREFWIKACHAFRGPDYTMLVRMCLGAGDVAVGIRGRLELDEVVVQGIVPLTLWVDNPRAPKDPTVEYGPEDCDVMIPNHGSLLEFYAKLRRFVKTCLFGRGQHPLGVQTVCLGN